MTATTVDDASSAVTDPAEVAERYRFYRPRILTWSIVGYAMFYFVRKNLPIAMPVMEKQLGIHKSSLGLFLTLSGLLYGVSKFINGVVGDRINARYFMAFGLVCSAAMNLCFGLSSAVITLGIFWMINGWFQGMGFPPCARLLTHWFEPKELATKMAIWNTSHGIGAAAVVILCGFLVDHYHNWRVCFYVPAGLAVLTAVLVLIFLRDTPASVGLPDLVTTGRKKAVGEGFSVVLIEKVFSNKYIWIYSLANFFVYTIRYAVLDWAPTMLKEFKGVPLLNAGMMVAAFEVAGVMGALCAGWLTDRFFGGRGARLSVVGMILCAVSIAIFWRVPHGHMFLGTGVLMSAGFFIYGPQALVGIAVANLATKDAAATAVGLTGLFGYASGVLSGWGIGKIVEVYGWDRAFIVLLVAAACGLVCFLLAWNAPRDGYIQAVME